jgi:hypothetical protein
MIHCDRFFAARIADSIAADIHAGFFSGHENEFHTYLLTQGRAHYDHNMEFPVGATIVLIA